MIKATQYSRIAITTFLVLANLVKGTDYIITMNKKLAKSSFSKLAYCKSPIPFPEIKFDMIWHRRAEHSGRNNWLQSLTKECLDELDLSS